MAQRDRSNGFGTSHRSWFAVLVAETRCVAATLILLGRGAISMPGENVGRLVRFADGSRSRIYRETAMRERSNDPSVLIVVRFRLRLLGTNRLAHWVFRGESLLNTLLFAAHRGFQTKLWLTDESTGYYRGIYEWNGQDAAEEYAETLRVVLQPWVEEGSFAYRVIQNQSRGDFLDGVAIEGPSRSEDGWWLPTGPEAPR